MKKDKIFTFVLVITAGNLVYQLMSILYSMVATKTFVHPIAWALLIANAIGVWGILWLLRSYKRNIKK